MPEPSGPPVERPLTPVEAIRVLGDMVEMLVAFAPEGFTQNVTPRAQSVLTAFAMWRMNGSEVLDG